MIKNFKSFLEARLSSILNLKGKSELYDELKNIKDAEFDSSKKLVKLITLSKRVNNKKIQFLINWNDTATHDLIKRIKDRTSFSSIEEFNNYFKDELNKVLPDMIGKEIHTTGRYNLYSSEYNFSIIISFNIENYIKNIFSINVITILPGKKNNNILNIIDIY